MTQQAELSSRHRDDTELVKAAARGEDDAFEALTTRYYGMVYALAFARLRDREASEDAAQEVFLRAHLKLAELEQPQFFSAWLTRVSRNLAEDWARRRESRSRLAAMVPLDGLAVEPADARSTRAREAIERREELGFLREAIGRLPAEHREVVLLHFLAGLSKAEISRRLGRHDSTVGRQLTQAVARLRSHLGETMGARVALAKPRGQAVRRAVLTSLAVAAMAPASRAELVTAALQSAGTIEATQAGATVSLAGFLSQSLMTGGPAVAAGKGLAVVCGTIAVIVGGYWYAVSADGGKDTQTTGQPEASIRQVGGGPDQQAERKQVRPGSEQRSWPPVGLRGSMYSERCVYSPGEALDEPFGRIAVPGGSGRQVLLRGDEMLIEPLDTLIAPLKRGGNSVFYQDPSGNGEFVFYIDFGTADNAKAVFEKLNVPAESIRPGTLRQMIRGQLRQVGQFVILIGDKTSATIGPDGINYLQPASADFVTSLDAFWARKK